MRAIRTNGYASKGESRRAEALKEFERAGSISQLVEQPSYLVSPDGCEPIRYVADFRYLDRDGKASGAIRDQEVVEDFKGKMTPVFSIKAKLFSWKFPQLIFIISKAIYGKVKGGKSDIIGFTTAEYGRGKAAVKPKRASRRVHKKAVKGVDRTRVDSRRNKRSA